MPIKPTSTLEGDLIVEIIKVKPGLYISQKDRKHMVANMFFLSFSGMSWSSHKVCSLLEWCFNISVGVSSDSSQLRCTGFAGSH